jgi:hypothetical protein
VVFNEPPVGTSQEEGEGIDVYLVDSASTGTIKFEQYGLASPIALSLQNPVRIYAAEEHEVPPSKFNGIAAN